MGNIADLQTIKDSKIKSSKIWGLPYGKAEVDTADKFLEAIVQYVGADAHVGILSDLPDDIKWFFRQSPKDPALGKGLARSFVGFTRPWLMPKIEVADQYKHIKPPLIPVKEEKIKESLKLQCSVAIETNLWMEHYIDKDQRDKLVAMLTQTVRSAIYTTICEFFDLFWTTLMLGFSFDNPTLLPYNIKATEADTGKAQGLLKKYQEDMETFAKIVQKEAQKLKNFVWYDPEIFANYSWKADNMIAVVEAKKPTAALNNQKAIIKALYVDGEKKIIISREQSLFAFLSMIKKAIYDLSKRRVASPENWIKYDPSKGATATDELWPCKVPASELCVVISHWDALDLEGIIKIDAKTGQRTISLSEATAGAARIITVDGLPPGFAYVGDKGILNFILVLDHSGQIEHLREEEMQWITNYWINFGSWESIGGKVIAPAKNYNPGGGFLSRYSKEINEA